MGLGERRHRADADVLVVEEGEPVGPSPRREDRRELGAQRLLVRVVLPRRELRPADHLAEPREEHGLERGDGERQAVGRLVDAVARERRR